MHLDSLKKLITFGRSVAGEKYVQQKSEREFRSGKSYDERFLMKYFFEKKQKSQRYAQNVSFCYFLTTSPIFPCVEPQIFGISLLKSTLVHNFAIKWIIFDAL